MTARGSLGAVAPFSATAVTTSWHPSRDNTTGELVPFPRFFPNGMKVVLDYVHNLGLKMGLYTSVGDKTCHGGWSPGSLGHFEQDANTFASWGVDYVKVAITVLRCARAICLSLARALSLGSLRGCPLLTTGILGAVVAPLTGTAGAPGRLLRRWRQP